MSSDDGMQPFNLTMKWGQEDEGLYHWAGRARDLAHATQLAREEMDVSYNDEYCRFGGEPRGIEGEEPTTEYVVDDYASGSNEFAAPEMLDALRLVKKDCNLPAEILAKVEHAIARGEGRV